MELVIGTILQYKTSGLLKGITSNHNGDFYCLNYLHSYRTISKLKKHEMYNMYKSRFLSSKNARC